MKIKFTGLFLLITWFCVTGNQCPPSHLTKVKFYEENKIKDKYNIILADGNCRLTIRGETFREKNDLLYLYIEARYRDCCATDFEFKTDALEVLANKRNLDFPTSGRTHTPKHGTRNEHISPFEGSDYYLVQIYKDTIKDFPVDIEIVLHNFIFYKGIPIKIDTIEVFCIE